MTLTSTSAPPRPAGGPPRPEAQRTGRASARGHPAASSCARPPTGPTAALVMATCSCRASAGWRSPNTSRRTRRPAASRWSPCGAGGRVRGLRRQAVQRRRPRRDPPPVAGRSAIAPLGRSARLNGRPAASTERSRPIQCPLECSTLSIARSRPIRCRRAWKDDRRPPVTRRWTESRRPRRLRGRCSPMSRGTGSAGSPIW
jgi:hypothetical protein